MHKVLEEGRSYFREGFSGSREHPSRFGEEGAKVRSRKCNGFRVLRTRIRYHWKHWLIDSEI